MSLLRRLSIRFSNWLAERQALRDLGNLRLYSVKSPEALFSLEDNDTVGHYTGMIDDLEYAITPHDVAWLKPLIKETTDYIDDHFMPLTSLLDNEVLQTYVRHFKGYLPHCLTENELWYKINVLAPFYLSLVESHIQLKQHLQEQELLEAFEQDIEASVS